MLILEDRSSALVTVGMMYRVGARNEAAGTTGLAHYNEHMNFRATRDFPGHEVTECITRVGGRWSGYTWIDQTYYAETVHRDLLDRMLDLEADRMLNALYDPEEFRMERTSVIAELNSYDDPQSVLYDAVLAASFEIHPYRNNTIGWLSDVENVTRDDAYRFYRRFYHPNNAVLVVVGDMDPEPTLAKVRERFGALAGSGEPTDVRTIEPPQTGQRRVAVRKPGPNARALLAFRAPALLDADFPAMVLFDALLAGGKGFRFTRDYATPPNTPLTLATVARGLATEAESDWQPSRYPYVYTVGASAPREQDLPALERALLRALAEAAAREWTDAEIAAALRQIRAGWALDLDDKAGRAHQLAFFEVSGGHRYLFDMPDLVARVSRDDIRRFAYERLQPQQATVGWFVPTEEGPAPEAPRAAPAPESAPVSLSPDAPSRLTAATPAEAQSLTLDNGLRVTLAPMPGAGLFALRGRVDAGSIYDGERPGLSALATEWLSRPRAGEDPAAPGLSFTLHEEPAASANLRFIELAAVGLPDELPALLRVLAGRLAAPVPPAIDWEALRRATVQRSAEADASAATALWRRGRAELFPAGAPLGSPSWGDEASLARTAPAALEGFLRQRVTSARTSLVVAGALDRAAARREVQETLGRLASSPSAAASSPPALPSPRGPAAWREIALPRPGKAQSDIRILWPGERSKPWDRAATESLLYLLGETGYAGRLGRALVEPGLAYSVYVTLEEEGTPGFLMIRTAASPRDTPEILRRIRAILDEAAQGRFTRAELDEATAYLRGKAARSREGTTTTAATLLHEALAARRTSPEDLTLGQLNDTARRLLGRGAPLALVAGP